MLLHTHGPLPTIRPAAIGSYAGLAHCDVGAPAMLVYGCGDPSGPIMVVWPVTASTDPPQAVAQLWGPWNGWIGRPPMRKSLSNVAPWSLMVAVSGFAAVPPPIDGMQLATLKTEPKVSAPGTSRFAITLLQTSFALTCVPSWKKISCLRCQIWVPVPETHCGVANVGAPIQLISAGFVEWL